MSEKSPKVEAVPEAESTSKVENRIEENEDELRRMVTTAGKKLELQPISHVLLSEINALVEQEFRNAGKPIDPPTYTAVLTDGSTVEYEHDDESLEYPMEFALRDADGDQDKAKIIALENTRDARQQWVAHKATIVELEEEIANRRAEYILGKGVIWDGVVPEEWIAETKEWGYNVPEGPRELRFYYLTRGLLETFSDQIKASGKILAMSTQGLDSALIQGALSFFRDKVEGGDGSPGPTEGEEPGMVDEPSAGEGS